VPAVVYESIVLTTPLSLPYNLVVITHDLVLVINACGEVVAVTAGDPDGRVNAITVQKAICDAVISVLPNDLAPIVDAEGFGVRTRTNS
jgi:hypothetical protein